MRYVFIAIIIVVALVVGLLAYTHYITPHKVTTTVTKTTTVTSTITETTKTSTTTTTATTTTTTTKPGMCTIYVIYVDPSQLSRVKEFTKKFTQELTRFGLNCSNYYFLHTSKFEVKALPAYPSLLIKGKLPSSLYNAFIKLGNYWLLKPPIFKYVSMNYGINIKMRFTYKSEVVVVNGSFPSSRIELKMPRNKLVELLSWTSSTNVTKIELVGQDKISTQLPYYPIILFKVGNVNITEYTPLLKPVSNGRYYTYDIRWFNEVLIPILSSYEGKEILLETHIKPDLRGPSIGSKEAPIKVLIFEDVYCPFCARFYANVMPNLTVNFIKKGIIEFIMKDFIVHRASVPIHEALVCYYERYGNGTKYYMTMSKLYELYMKKGQVTLSDVSDILGLNASKLRTLCDASKVLKEEAELASKYGVLGTPTFVIWNNDMGKGLILVGYAGYREFVSLINEVLGINP